MPRNSPTKRCRDDVRHTVSRCCEHSPDARLHVIAERPILIPHIDDLGCAKSTNDAMVELARIGSVTSGSVIVPAMWFADITASAETQDMDLGVHLTLTSESHAARWRPISTVDRSSGLFDPSGFMWATVSAVREAADPAAVEAEMRAQVQTAIDCGIDVTHLDHHMGAALAPEFVEHTVDIAIDFDLPVLFPRDIEGLLAVSEVGPVDVSVVRAALTRASKNHVAFGDTFLMPLEHRDRSDHDAVLKRYLSDIEGGVVYLALHASAPGDIQDVHPNDAAWRLGEYAVMRDQAFVDWLFGLDIDVVGVKWLRERLRNSMSHD
ncbi:MAG: ChbG/HpnK family deacetylase [Acidimicrobiia bacterium]